MPRTALLYAVLTGLYILALDLSLDLLTVGVSRHPAARLVLVVATVSLSFFFLSRELQVHWHAEQVLRQARDELQVRVHERTAGLAQANEALRAEIAGRSQTEAKLVEAEARYRTLVEHIPAITYITAPDETGAMLYISPQIEALLGFSPADCQNDPHFWETHLHLDDQPRVQAEFTHCSTTGEPLTSEYRVVARDGRVLTFRDEAVLVRGADGQPLCIQGVMFDMTHRKRAEEALRQSEETARGLLNAITDGAFLIDVTGVVLAMNEATAQRIGKSADELLGSCIYDFLAPPVAQGRRAQVDEAIRLRKPVRFEDESDGSCIDSSVYPILDAQGRVARIAIYGRDITVQRQTEKLLMRHALEMEELYKTSLEVNSQLDVPLLLQAIIQRATELIGVEAGALYLMKPDGQALELVVGYRMRLARIGVTLHLGEGLAGRVAQSGRPLIVEDYHNWEGRASVFADSPYHPMLGVPLKVRDTVIGVIIATDDQRTAPFREEHVRLLNLFAAQAAIAIENARLYQAERNQREFAETLREVSAALVSILEVDTVLDRLLERLSYLVPNDAADIRLIEDDHSRVVRSRGYERFGHRDLESLTFQVAPVDDLKEIAETGRPVFIPDTHAEPRWQHFAGFDWLRSYAGAPIRIQGKIRGFLDVVSATPGFFGPQHAEVLRGFADQAAIALRNAWLYEEAQKTAGHLQALSHRLVEAQETERRNIARELHDQIGQLITGLKLRLEMCARLPDDTLRDTLGEAQTLVQELLERVRELSLDLRPTMLDDLGLVPALLWLFERFTVQTNVPVAFKHIGVEQQRFAPQVETAAYRIAQEALTNVARHACASAVTVRLWATPETLGVQVEDDGAGFDPEAALANGTSTGLSSMHERAKLLSGHLEIESSTNAGTRLTAELPLNDLVQAP